MKPPSDLDINLEDGVGDQEYLDLLREGCAMALREFQPQLLMYIAGADPYGGDQLGGLSLSIEGLKARDALVFELARANHAAVAVTLAGGYAVDVEDTVTIHSNTAHAAAESLMQESR